MSKYGVLINPPGPPLSLAETFKLARETIAGLSEPDPPWTYSELRHIYDARRNHRPIFQRCAFSDTTGRLEPDLQFIYTVTGRVKSPQMCYREFMPHTEMDRWVLCHMVDGLIVLGPGSSDAG